MKRGCNEGFFTILGLLVLSLLLSFTQLLYWRAAALQQLSEAQGNITRYIEAWDMIARHLPQEQEEEAQTASSSYTENGLCIEITDMQALIWDNDKLLMRVTYDAQGITGVSYTV